MDGRAARDARLRLTRFMRRDRVELNINNEYHAGTR